MPPLPSTFGRPSKSHSSADSIFENSLAKMNSNKEKEKQQQQQIGLFSNLFKNESNFLSNEYFEQPKQNSYMGP